MRLHWRKEHGAGRGRGYDNKTAVLGIKERGGRMRTKVIPDVKKATLRSIVAETVERSSIVSTDELVSYGLLKGDGYTHGAVDHSWKEFNGVESFWMLDLLIAAQRQSRRCRSGRCLAPPLERRTRAIAPR
jgi:transposase-like protein